jgi:hypothetical protein
VRANLDHVAVGECLVVGRGAMGDDPPVIDDRHLAGELVGLVQVLRGEQHVGAVSDQVAYCLP